MSETGSTGSTGSTYAITPTRAHAHGPEKDLPLYQCYQSYFDRVREGLPPADSPTEQGDSETFEESSCEADEAESPATQPDSPATWVAADPVPEAAEREIILLSALASDLPDPARSFWWFSSTPLPDRRVPAGMPLPCAAGSRLPMEADYWAHEGDAEWTKIDRNVRPKPEAKKRVKRR